MDKTAYDNSQDRSARASLRGALHDIIQASKKRRLVIRNREGHEVIDISVLLATLLSIGAPVLPAAAILGVMVDAIRVSIEER